MGTYKEHRALTYGRGVRSTELISTLRKPSGHYTHHQFNNQQFYVLPTQCIYVCCVDLETNSDFFPIQH